MIQPKSLHLTRMGVISSVVAVDAFWIRVAELGH